MTASSTPTAAAPHLAREMGLAGLIATAICAMIGVGINIIPFMIQRSQPGVGAAVPLVFIITALPAGLAALCYAMLSSAMPRAGGSYVYATRALSPFPGFLASFAQWFGLSMGMGVVAYLLVPMLRDTLATAGWPEQAPVFDEPFVRVPIALLAIWSFWWVNLRGIKTYERTVVVMTAAMVAGPLIMTVTGFLAGPGDFDAAIARGAVIPPPAAPLPEFSVSRFMGAAVVLFSSFIGFDAISQAGGEARNPSRNLPLSILIAIGAVAAYYILFTAAVYKAVPWEHIYRVSLVRDVSAPALLAPLMPRWLGVLILVTVTVSILDSIPSVMLANSRMIYAFSADRIFPRIFARVHARFRTPHHATTLTAVAGSLSVLGCAFAGDFFLGVDLLVVSMLVNFFLMALAVLAFPSVNPELYQQVRFLRSRRAQVLVASSSLALLGGLLLVQVVMDVGSAAPWYLKSTTSWTATMGLGALIFARSWRALRREGIDPARHVFRQLPNE
jgi:basic amino acid/polyamine antiporter, APA family